MGDGNLGVAGHGQASRHAGNDLQGNAAPRARRHFLGQAAEDARVARLQADHRLALPGGFDHLGVDLVLGDVPAGAVMAQANPLGRGRGVFQDQRVDQVVIEHHVGLTQALGRPEGQQARIAGTGAGQVDFAGFFLAAAHRVARRLCFSITFFTIVRYAEE